MRRQNARNSKKYVVIEFRSDEDCRQFASSPPPSFETMFEGSKLTPRQVRRYTESLLDESKKEARLSRRSPGTSKHTGFLKGMGSEDILMIYPFPADKVAMESTTEGLKELRGTTLRDNDIKDIHAEVIKTRRSPSRSGEDKGDSGEGKAAEKRGRAHYLTVRVEDYERLEPGEFLNDTLIDLFLQW